LVFKCFHFLQSDLERFGDGIDDHIRRLGKSFAGIGEGRIEPYQSETITDGDIDGEDISS